jgi:hypothetical protein
VHIPRRSKWWVAGLVGNALFIALPVAFWIVYRRVRLASSKKLRSNPGGSLARHGGIVGGGGGGASAATTTVSGASGAGGSGGGAGGTAFVSISSAVEGGGNGGSAAAAKGLSAAAADKLERGVRKVSDKPEDDVSAHAAAAAGRSVLGGGVGCGRDQWVCLELWLFCPGSREACGWLGSGSALDN